MAESMKELREGLKCYLSFSNEEVFKGLALLETSAVLVKEAIPQSTGMTPASTTKGGAIVRVTKEPAMEKRSPKFLRWEKVLHPSQPVVAAGQIPHPSGCQRLREE